MSSTWACTFSWGPRIPVMNHFVCGPGLSHFLPHEGASARLWEVGGLEVSILPWKEDCFCHMLSDCSDPVCAPPGQRPRGEEGWVVSALRENSEWAKEHSLPFSELCKQSMPTLGFHKQQQEVFAVIPGPPPLSLPAPHRGVHLTASPEFPLVFYVWGLTRTPVHMVRALGLASTKPGPKQAECVVRFC